MIIVDCLFCKIVNKIIDAKIIAENEGAIAFLDINPMSDGHTIIISKKHFLNFSSCGSQDLFHVVELVKKVSHIIQDSSLKPWGFNYLSNEGSVAGQVVMHFHIHVIPKYGKTEGFIYQMGNKYLGTIDRVYRELMKVNPKKHV